MTDEILLEADDAADMDASMGDIQPPSLYSIEKMSSTKAWSSIRTRLLETVIVSNVLPSSVCIHCCSDPVQYRCMQCEPSARYYCHVASISI